MNAQARKWYGGSVILLLLIVALGMGPLSPLARSAELARVYVSPPTREVLVTRSSYVELRVENVVGLFAAELHLAYDPSIISIADADGSETGVQIGAGNVFDGKSWHVDENMVDTVASTIYYQIGLDTFEATGVDGDYVLARIDFTGVTPGVCPIIWDRSTVELSMRGGENIDHTLDDGEVRVVIISSTATGTPSQTPTSGPSPTATATSDSGPSPTASATPLSGNPDVYIEPAPRWVLPGTSSFVDIKVQNAQDVYGAWVSVTFDENLVEVLSVEPASDATRGTGYLFTGDDWYQLESTFSNVVGTARYGAKLSFDQPIVNDHGILARVHFRALRLGVSPFDLVDTILTDRQGVSLEHTRSNGQIIVSTEIPSVTVTPGPSETVTPQPSVTPDATTMIYLDPEVQTMAVGGEGDILVRVDNVSGLYGAQFTIGYDPSVIAVVDADAGTPGVQVGIGGFLTPDSILANIADNGSGMIQFAISQTPPTAARSGSGVLATIRVRALAQGASSLAIMSTQLTSQGGGAIPHDAAGAFVSVNSRIVTGHVLLQGRDNHIGAQLRGPLGELYAQTAADGGFVFECPVGVGETMTVTAMNPGYLSATTSLVIPGDQVVDLGVVTLMGGDPVGNQTTVDRAAGCPGDPSVVMPGLPDGKVNIVDLTFVGGHFGASSLDMDWEPTPDGCHPEWIAFRADINGDDLCNIYDLVQVGNNFDAVGPSAW